MFSLSRWIRAASVDESYVISWISAPNTRLNMEVHDLTILQVLFKHDQIDIFVNSLNQLNEVENDRILSKVREMSFKNERKTRPLNMRWDDVSQTILHFTLHNNSRDLTFHLKKGGITLSQCLRRPLLSCQTFHISNPKVSWGEMQKWSETNEILLFELSRAIEHFCVFNCFTFFVFFHRVTY